MIGFMFQLLIMLLVGGLLWYLIRWTVGYLGLPQPVLVVVTVLLIIMFLYVCWSYFPAGGMGALPRRVR